MEPQARIGIAELTKMAFAGVDLYPLRSQLLTQCLQDQSCAGAFMDLSVIDQLNGNRELGLEWQSKAFETCRVFKTQRAAQAKLRVLVFAAPIDMGSNTPIEFLLQTSDFEIIYYYPGETVTPVDALPDHDVAFCAAPTDGPGAEAFLSSVRTLSRRAGTRTLNLPNNRVSLERDHLTTRLAGISGLRVPKSLRLRQEDLTGPSNAIEGLASTIGAFPYVVRPCGSHAGHGLDLVRSLDELTRYLSERDEADFYLSDYIDFASPHDRAFRKYRIVFVDGRAFPCHMAISDQWKIWYLNANMQASAPKRREEAAFMQDFESGFGGRHRQALEQIAQRVGLNYFGIDCAEDADGNLVVFEADNALIVHDMDSDELFPYKRGPMRAIFAAFETMLAKNCWTAAPNLGREH